MYYKQRFLYLMVCNENKTIIKNKASTLVSSSHETEAICSKLRYILSSSTFLTISSVKSVLIDIFLVTRKNNPSLLGIKAVLSGRWFNTLDNRSKKLLFTLGNSSYNSTNCYSSFSSISFVTSYGLCNIKLWYSYFRGFITI